MSMNESIIEQSPLLWLAELPYDTRFGPDNASGKPNVEWMKLI